MNLLSSVQRNIFVKLMEKLERHTAVCNIQPFSQYFWLLRSQKVGFRLNLVNFCRHGQHHITKCDELPFLQCSRVLKTFQDSVTILDLCRAQILKGWKEKEKGEAWKGPWQWDWIMVWTPKLFRIQGTLFVLQVRKPWVICLPEMDRSHTLNHKYQRIRPP